MCYLSVRFVQRSTQVLLWLGWNPEFADQKYRYGATALLGEQWGELMSRPG